MELGVFEKRTGNRASLLTYAIVRSCQEQPQQYFTTPSKSHQYMEYGWLTGSSNHRDSLALCRNCHGSVEEVDENG